MSIAVWWKEKKKKGNVFRRIHDNVLLRAPLLH